MSTPKEPAKQSQRLPDSELGKVSGGGGPEPERANDGRLQNLIEKTLEREKGG